MNIKYLKYLLGAACIGFLVQNSVLTEPAWAQETAAAEEASDEADSGPEPLTEEEMEVLVARIALYPDELVAVISAASLYPLQIVEASRYLEQYEKDNSLEPDEDWDGSIISLLNYPEIVQMMSDDLNWTQSLGDALAFQQEDVLIAIQQLREQAVADGIIQSDDKMEVVEEDDNIVINSTSTETVYVPQYEPQMLYSTSYAPAPVTYYPNPYPRYYYPGATFFAGAVTGAVWASAVDWNNGSVWGGNYKGGDVKIDCNNCFNDRDFNGKIDMKDVDWKNVDRNKINVDKDQFKNVDRKNIKNDIKRNTDNSIGKKSRENKKTRQAHNKPKTGSRDVRKSMQDGLKKPQGGNRNKATRPAGQKKQASRPSGSKNKANKSRPSGAKKAGGRQDTRPKSKSSLGHTSKGKKQKHASKRGSKSMGGGSRGGGRSASKHRGGGSRKGGGGKRRR